MDKKKILIVSAWFYPEITPRSFRTTELAKELAQQGHEVVVYIPFKGNSYTSFSKKYGVIIRNLGKLRFPNIRISSYPVLNFLSRTLRRILILLFEYPNIEFLFKVDKALKNEKGYDMLISIASPHSIHWGVAKSINKKNQIAKTWVADCGDPFMGSNISGYKKLFYFKHIEKWFCKKADVLTIPRVEMKENYYSEFHSKIKVIPQGFNFGENKIAKYVKNDIPTFAFAGLFIPKKRDPRQLMDFLVNYNHPFKFIIYSNNPDLITPYKDKLGDNLEIKKYIPRAKLIYELSKMDFLINISYDPIHQSPSKLIDYTFAGRPILNIPGNLNETSIREFLNGNYTNQFKIENFDKFNIKNVVKQFLELTLNSH